MKNIAVLSVIVTHGPVERNNRPKLMSMNVVITDKMKEKYHISRSGVPGFPVESFVFYLPGGSKEKKENSLKDILIIFKDHIHIMFI